MSLMSLRNRCSRSASYASYGYCAYGRHHLSNQRDRSSACAPEPARAEDEKRKKQHRYGIVIVLICRVREVLGGAPCIFWREALCAFRPIFCSDEEEPLLRVLGLVVRARLLRPLLRLLGQWPPRWVRLVRFLGRWLLRRLLWLLLQVLVRVDE